MSHTETLEAIAESILATEPNRAIDWARGTIMGGLQDAYDLGITNSTPATPAPPRDAFGQAKDPEKRQGFVLNAVNTITAEQIAEHGEDALLAWIRQTLRELAANGANPMKDAAFQIVGLEDGTVVVTAEAGV